jgi:hypothetical protein
LCLKDGEIASLACEGVAELFETTGKTAKFGHAQSREGLIKCLRIYENNGDITDTSKEEHWKQSSETTTSDLEGQWTMRFYTGFSGRQRSPKMEI